MSPIGKPVGRGRAIVPGRKRFSSNRTKANYKLFLQQHSVLYREQALKLTQNEIPRNIFALHESLGFSVQKKSGRLNAEVLGVREKNLFGRNLAGRLENAVLTLLRREEAIALIVGERGISLQALAKTRLSPEPDIQRWSEQIRQTAVMVHNFRLALAHLRKRA